MPADTMIIGSKTYTGMLQGYENGHFIFKTTDWKTIKKPRTNIKKIIPDSPYNVTYAVKGKKKEAKLIKYEKSKFFLKQEGKETEAIYGVSIKNLKIEKKSSYSMPPGHIPRDQGLKTSLNIKELVNSANLSDSQKVAIKSYIKTRKAYIQFQKESSVLVKQRDQANGKKREALINKLHLRKNAEQPLKNELRNCVRKLDNEFAGNMP